MQSDSLRMPGRFGMIPALLLVAGTMGGCGADDRPPNAAEPSETNFSANGLYLKAPGYCWPGGSEPSYLLIQPETQELPIGLPYQMLVGWYGTGTITPFQATFTVDNVPWDSTSDFSWFPTQSAVRRSCAASWTPPDTGYYRIGAILDTQNRVAESNEDDNAVSAIVRFVLPDLEYSSIFANEDSISAVTGLFGSNTVHAGATVHIVVRGTCSGDFPDYRFRLLSGDSILQDGRVGCTRYRYFSGIFDRGDIACYHRWVAPSTPADYVLRFEVDVDDEYVERREDNNVRSEVVRVLP